MVAPVSSTLYKPHYLCYTTPKHNESEVRELNVSLTMDNGVLCVNREYIKGFAFKTAASVCKCAQIYLKKSNSALPREKSARFDPAKLSPRCAIV